MKDIILYSLITKYTKMRLKILIRIFVFHSLFR